MALKGHIKADENSALYERMFDFRLFSSLAEREISVDHSTILRWVRRYAPEFEKKWHSYAAHLIGPSWRVDESVLQQHRKGLAMNRV
jgi:transposase-like protein